MSHLIASFQCSTSEETETLAKELFRISAKGDTFHLEGGIGAGKSTFARAFIKEACGPETEVPSPTFTLVQTYNAPSAEIWHCDLYRLTSPDEVLELGLDIAFKDAITLIEWPDRLGEEAPETALRLNFELQERGRMISVVGNLEWAKRLVNLNGQ